jgi:tripartite-type tricarboxylate transporter receptor subunit TctC
MELPRRTFLRFTGACVAAPVFSEFAKAQSYPTRPVTMIVPLAAGGSVDAMARVLAEGMRKSLGQSVVIENVSGADGSIGITRTARARPDGYTIDFGGISTHVLNGAFYSLQYNLLDELAPIAAVGAGPLLLIASKTVPANDLRELIDWLKANPNKASAGIGLASIRLMNYVFQKETGTRFALVPYRGNAPAMRDLLAGQIDLLFDAVAQLPLLRAGNIKAYAVTTDTRFPTAPDIPTFRELGLPALSISSWVALFAPKGTPRDIISKLNTAVMEALTDPAVRSRLLDFGIETFPREQQTPEALEAMRKADAEKWWPIIKEAGIKAE